jgi:MSHA biogenesis protein MshQ
MSFLLARNRTTRYGSVVGVFIALFLVAGFAHAARTINSVTLNGASSVIVGPGATITAVANVTTDGSGNQQRWRCTSWSTTGSTSGTDNFEPDHDSSGTYSETFSITAPATPGTYSASFIAYRDDACSQDASTTYTLPNSIVVPPLVSSINRASASPARPNVSVSWTVVFSASVTGVNAADFTLVQGGGVSGATINPTVSGSGTTWTVTANTGSGGGTLGLNLVDDDTINTGGTSLGGPGAGNGNFTGQTYTIDNTSPSVASITRVNTSPTSLLSVSWNVTFSEAVSGVNDADFSLIETGGLTSTGIMSVSGAGINWVVTASTGSGTGTMGLNLIDNDSIIDAAGNPLGGAGVDNGNFTGDVYSVTPNPCPPPSNIPSGVTVTCQCDNFTGGTLNPSTIFGGNWVATTSDTTGIVPRIVTTGYMRLTENTGNNAKAATVPGIFPAAGNYISVEFLHYAYRGSNPGADGIAITLSDYSIPAQPGAFGGSLGYAQRTGVVGFAGGWIGVALDEYGNYQNPTEGRLGGTGFIRQSVGVRGSGSGSTGYSWLAGTPDLTTVAPNLGIDNRASTTPAPGYRYQIVVDARNEASGVTAIAVNRDTSGAGTYSSLISVPNVSVAATSAGFTQGAVPAHWQISFTGSTGGSNNIHEIAGLKICAQSMVPLSGGTLGGFNAIDEAYARGTNNALQGHIFTKLAGTPFKLNVAALNATSTAIQTTYAISGNKSVTVELIDDSGSATSCNATAVACTGCSKPVVATQTMIFTSGDTGFKKSADFTVDGAYSRLLARVRDGTATGCSVDVFVVRPTEFSSPVSSASNTGLTGTPVIKAGSDTFTMSVTANAINYAGAAATPQISAAAMEANGAGWAVGAISPVIFPAASASTASESFTYGEVGNFRFLGYDPATNTTSSRGIYDNTWTGVDQGAQADCVAGSYSNTKDANGKYGCLFGLTANSSWFGRFVPDHFAMVSGATGQFCTGIAPNLSFSYMGQPRLNIAYQLEARNGANAKTSNYSAALVYPVTAPTLVAEDQTTGNQGCDLAARISGLPATVWSAGTYTVPATDTIFSRPTTLAALDTTSAATCSATRTNASGPFWQLDIGIQMMDADGAVITEVTSPLTLPALDMNAATSGACSGSGCTARRIGTTGEVFGRLRLLNTYGSELLPARVEYRAEYWDSSRWATNTSDKCTSILPANIAIGNGTLSPVPATFSITSFSAGAGGVGFITIPRTNAVGSFDLALDLGAGASPAQIPLATVCEGLPWGTTGNPTTTTGANLSYLAGNWCGTAYDRYPNARIKFGSPKAPYIYFRERY